MESANGGLKPTLQGYETTRGRSRRAVSSRSGEPVLLTAARGHLLTTSPFTAIAARIRIRAWLSSLS